MKLNEIITEATKQDYVGCDADSILAQAQTTMTVRPRRSGIKKVILIAAAICLVIGSEGFGMSKNIREKCDFLVSIPMYGKVNSFNVSTAASVLMAEISRH